MKKYNRAQEKRKDLISVINYTISNEDGKAAKKINRRRSKGKQKGGKASGRVAGYDRKNDGKRKHQSGRGRSQDWCPTVQREQDHAAEVPREFRFSGEDGRMHWVGCGAEDFEEQILNEGPDL